MTKSRLTGGLILRPLILCIIVLPFITTSLALASDFDPKVPVAFRDRLYDVQFISETEAIIIGYPGKVFRSADGGETWERIAIGTTEPLFSLHFINAKTGWIAGRSGLIFITGDGGKTWTKQDSGVSEHLFGIHFFNEKVGVAVGNFGIILNTVDGGKTWASQILQEMSSATIYAVQMLDENTGFLAGEYPTWEAQLEEDVEASTLSSVFRTSDGGITWERVEVPTESHLFDLQFVSAQEGYAVGTKGFVLKTLDGGVTWEAFNAPTPFHLLSVEALGDNIVAVGNAGTAVYKKGDEIKIPPTGAYSWIGGVSFNKKGRGVLVGDHGLIMLSEDKGLTWTCLSPTCKGAFQQKTK
jgi:photosystem II stability/assembly factor-like uncharacterized protein